MWHSSLLLRGGIHSVHFPRSFVGLSKGCVARRSLLVSALVTSGSVLSGLPQSSMPTCMPQFSLLLEPSTAVVRVCCGTVIRGRLVGHVLWSVSSLSDSPQQRPRVSVSASPFSAARRHNPTRTAIIFVCVDSFIQALTAEVVASPRTYSSHITLGSTRYNGHSQSPGICAKLQLLRCTCAFSASVSGWTLCL